MFDHPSAVDPRFVHEGERNRNISFPLGGIASGGFAISGSGRYFWTNDISGISSVPEPLTAARARASVG